MPLAREALVRVGLVAALLLTSCGVADDGPAGSSPAGGGSQEPPTEGPGGPGSDPRTIDGWFEVLDRELAAVGGASWTEDHEAHAVPICGPADEFEGWQLFAGLRAAEDGQLDPPEEDWEETDLGGDAQPHVWRHRDHDGLLIRADADRRQGEVHASSYGLEHDDWAAGDGMPDAHPRVHPRPLDPGTGQPVRSFCG